MIREAECPPKQDLRALHTQIAACQAHMHALLLKSLPAPASDSPLFEAMHYACLNGGKRLRPLLVYMAAALFEDTPSAPKVLDSLAVAIELIHCYSLVHDDLPAMDNDDLRRGKPTCHKMFGEALAILAGDALLTLAFEMLMPDPLRPFSLIIAKAAGAKGMIQGQARDLASPPSLSLEALCQLHLAKTGALMGACLHIGALATGKATPEELLLLEQYGQTIGLAFQIQDDILDVDNATPSSPCFVASLGLNKARDYVCCMINARCM